MLQQHDRHHTMLANPYDPSRDLSPNLPTTSCRGQELTNVFSGAGGQCCAFKTEFDDDCPSDCCSKVSAPPTPMGVVVGDDYRGGPLAVLPCKQEPVTATGGLVGPGLGSSPVAGHHHHHHHHHHHQSLSFPPLPPPSRHRRCIEWQVKYVHGSTRFSILSVTLDER